MENLSLIANSGIQMSTFAMELDMRERYEMWFREWYNTTEGMWVLDLVQPVNTETSRYFYPKKDLFDNGYLRQNATNDDIDVTLLNEDGIYPLMIDENQRCTGEIYRMTFSDRANTLSAFENKWLPVPYFFKRSESRFKFGPLNWSRFMLVPFDDNSEGRRRYTVVLAFDTRTAAEDNGYQECPIFPDAFRNEIEFDVCSHEFQLVDYVSPGHRWEYINEYLFHLVHPDVPSVGQLHTARRLDYVASYLLLVNYIATHNLFPHVIMHKDNDVVVKDVDMVVDIGNSRTTALLVEDNFNQAYPLQLQDYTTLLSDATDKSGARMLNIYNEPFDMRLALRAVSYGDFGIKGSTQFATPSFVRLGREANTLIHRATENDVTKERLTTLSSPKRYLWDGRKSREEWKFIVLEGERDNHILHIPGLSEHLTSDGRVTSDGRKGGQSYHFSRRSMMTMAFLEMLQQAQVQINSQRYRRTMEEGDKPRRIRRIVVTCPTAMSKVEREALVRCASDAVSLLNRFRGIEHKVDVVPKAPSFRDSESRWYYDEATCSQLVYIYGEVGHKYKGACQEFFNLYGRRSGTDKQPTLTVGSLDIGAGTSDLMINSYSYIKGDVTTIKPEPLFYDSFYYAGDDMLKELIKIVMFYNKNSALRQHMPDLSDGEYRQRLRDFFGPDHNGQTVSQRKLRRDFNMQYSVPLMYHFLDLLSRDSRDCVVTYDDVFGTCEPNRRVAEGFKEFFGFDMRDLEWQYDGAFVSDAVAKAFEPLLKKIATMLYAYKCDIVLLSGRPSSLAPVRNIFLKYYTVSPNRLILLNNYYVGDWYPFDKNTGSITNPKTIVAVGALVGYYATSLAKLDRFLIDKTALDSNLKSVINYIESSRDGAGVSYFITPEQNTGQLMIATLPTILSVRQIGIDSYPSRKLYEVGYNRFKIGDKVRAAAMQNGENPTDATVMARVKEIVDDLEQRKPYRLTVERDADDKETLRITSVVDKNGNEISESNIEINIQSLGADERYWLDTGEFDIQ